MKAENFAQISVDLYKMPPYFSTDITEEPGDYNYL